MDNVMMVGWITVGMSCVENSNGNHVCYGTAAVESQGRSSIAFRTKVKEVFRPADLMPKYQSSILSIQKSASSHMKTSSSSDS